MKIRSIIIILALMAVLSSGTGGVLIYMAWEKASLEEANGLFPEA